MKRGHRAYYQLIPEKIKEALKISLPASMDDFLVLSQSETVRFLDTSVYIKHDSRNGMYNVVKVSGNGNERYVEWKSVVVRGDRKEEMIAYREKFVGPEGSAAEKAIGVSNTLLLLEKAEADGGNVYKLGGNRLGGQITGKLADGVWIMAGQFLYKVWLSEEGLVLQRHNLLKMPVGWVHLLEMDNTYTVGRHKKKGDYALPSDPTLSGRYFSVRVTKDGQQGYVITVIDLNSKNGTEVFGLDDAGQNSDGGTPDTKTTGGIDFRALPIATQPMGEALMREIINMPKINISDLDQEWAGIQKMVESESAPSLQRVKEFLAACYQRGELKQRADKVLASLAGILRIEEDECRATQPEMRVMLALLEYNR